MADLAFLRTFLGVYRAGSLTKAARGLHLSQPAVSHHLKALEADLGRPLFIRLARGISPTPAGHELAREVAAHLDALEGAAQAVSSRSQALEGTVHLGGPADFLAERAMRALAPLAKQGVRLRCRTGLADRLVAELAEGALDLVVAAARSARAGVSVEPLYEEEFVLVGARAFKKKPLADAPLVAFADDLPIVRRYFRAALGVRVGAAARVVIDDLRAVREAVKAGAGISALPSYLVEAALRRGELVKLHEPKQPVTNTIWLAARGGSLRHPRVAAVREALKAIG
jgi:DNA-binding transcriptional LysR family regulator